jgi:hypothetical protein
VGAIATLDNDKVRTEIDNHADTCLVGRNAHVFQHFDRQVNLTGYDPSLGTVKNQDIVSAALAYDDPATGEVMILVLHQVIHVPALTHNLICPMQMWMNGVSLDECPKFLTDNPLDNTHAMAIPSKDGAYLISLSLHGVTSYFPTRKPTIK